MDWHPFSKPMSVSCVLERNNLVTNANFLRVGHAILLSEGSAWHVDQLFGRSF
jgi:hypothetical protein